MLLHGGNGKWQWNFWDVAGKCEIIVHTAYHWNLSYFIEGVLKYSWTIEVKH